MDPHHDHNKKLSTGDLFASAKVLAESATAKDKMDKAKAAAAAADLLDGVQQYGYLEGNKYVDKADTYLHQYSSKTTHSTSPSSTHAPEKKDSHSTTHSTSPSSTHAPEKKTSHSAGEDKSESGGYGEYFKMAQGFLK